MKLTYLGKDIDENKLVYLSENWNIKRCYNLGLRHGTKTIYKLAGFRPDWTLADNNTFEVKEKDLLTLEQAKEKAIKFITKDYKQTINCIKNLKI